MNVLSLFDGIRCGRVALERAGIEVDKYYSSEIDKNSIKIGDKNYPQDIINKLGDVSNWKNWNLPNIDLLIGGSPCRNLSKTATRGGSKNWDNFEEGLNGDSKLFYYYLEILKTLKPKYFLFENVEMKKETEDIISELFECKPIIIDSADFSAQNRKRLYWTNIKVDKIDNINNLKLIDILEKKVDEKYYYNIDYECLESETLYCKLNFNFKAHDIARRVYKTSVKSPTLTSCRGGNLQKKVFINGRVRKLAPEECKAVQGFPATFKISVSDSQAWKQFGNSVSVPVLNKIMDKVLELNIN